jgi:hypothetical protein
MLAMRPNCEGCDTDLPADAAGAWICSFECTFCASCALGPLAGRCPNCDGGLQMRPLRVGSALARHPGSSTRVRAERAAATHVERASNPPPRLAGVRALCSEDRREWEALWEGYLAFYGSALAPSTTEATWRRLLDPSAHWPCRLPAAGPSSRSATSRTSSWRRGPGVRGWGAR